jgi:dipeptidyl aminopeptidase/acylaminoacyl peptidase
LLRTENDDYVVRNQVAKFVGDGANAVEGSPLRQAASIQAPVLLVHGDRDLNVGFAHSQRMQAALQSAGKQSEFVSFAGLDHQLEDNQARTQMLTKIGQLLDRTIGH